VLASLGAFAGRPWWVLDLVANLRVQLAAGLLVVGLGLALLRSWSWAALCAAGVAVNLALVAPLLAPAPPDVAAGPALRIVSFNLRAASREHEAIAERLRRTAADVVFLTEAYGDWPQQLRDADLPFQMVQPGANTGLLWLRRSSPLAWATGPGHPRVASTLTVAVEGRDVQIIGVHPVRPLGRAGTMRRDDQLREVADAVGRGADRPPTVVVGDLNATRWSAAFDPLVEAGLRDSAVGFGWQPTWPAGMGLLGIPIDHALTTRELAVSRTVTAWPGSDHRALEVVLALPDPAAAQPARPAHSTTARRITTRTAWTR